MSSFEISGQPLAPASLSPRRLRLSYQLPLEVVELIGHFPVILAVGIDGSHGVQDGGVVAAAEVAADLLQAVPRVPPRQVHADLPRECDALVSFLALQI